MIYFASKKLLWNILKNHAKNVKNHFFFFFTFFKIYSQVLVFPPIITYLAYACQKIWKFTKTKWAINKKKLFTLMKQLLWNTSKLKQNKQHILVFDWKNSHIKKTHTSLFCNKIGIKSALLLVIFFSRDFS